MTYTRTRQPILVLGGTGKTGNRVVRRLEARGHAVRIGSRSHEPRFDWDDAATWDRAVQGIRAVYITYQPDLAVPGAVETVRSFAETALKAGVRRMVLLSGRGEEEAERAEQALQDTGAEWTIVRASWFAQNFSESFLLDALRTGEVALPAGPTKEPFIDAEDIADVVVEALTDASHIGRLYEVTGARLLTFADAIGEISEASGRAIRYREIAAEDYAAQLAAHGVPNAYVSLVTYLFTTVLDGRNARRGDGVQRALGREPRDFATYARETATTGVWNIG
ncbi:MAG: NmrA family transcriptional regulator [Alphaproteobacteria bacterium]|nr:MAG: NmrA family transcriptional regulator [Alphaproteobacteria bacterium]